jgi:hypothetical protein
VHVVVVAHDLIDVVHRRQRNTVPFRDRELTPTGQVIKTSSPCTIVFASS